MENRKLKGENGILINRLGELALSTRLLRLSEITRADVTRIYKENGIGFEAKWFPVLYVLSQKSPLSIREIAGEIGYTHPSVIALTTEMEQKKWIQSRPDKKDGRKRQLQLTASAEKKIRLLAPLWDKMRVVAGQVYNNGSSLLKAVEDTENALAAMGYYERYSALDTKKSTR